MYTKEKIDKFRELRARGWSLGHIATELDVSKRTLVDWNREYAKEVESFRTLERELLKEKFIASREEELNDLHRLQKDIADELGNRQLKYIDTEKLFRLSVELRKEINQLRFDSGSDDPKPRPGPERHNGNGHHKATAGNGRMAVHEEDPSPKKAQHDANALDERSPSLPLEERAGERRPNRTTVLPLPKGEGRGEGERDAHQPETDDHGGKLQPAIAEPAKALTQPEAENALPREARPADLPLPNRTGRGEG